MMPNCIAKGTEELSTQSPGVEKDLHFKDMGREPTKATPAQYRNSGNTSLSQYRPITSYAFIHRLMLTTILCTTFCLSL